MTKFFGRSILLNVGSLYVESADDQTILSIDFKVEKTGNRTTNKANITITNLTKEHREASLAKGTPIVLEAGYRENRQRIFAGTLNYGVSHKQGSDWITELECADGGVVVQANRFQGSFAPGTKIEDVAKKVIQSMGVGEGNALTKLSGALRGNQSEYPQGFAASGLAVDVFDTIVRNAGFTWSIQDGVLQVLSHDETVSNEAYVLSSNSGLIGAPDIGPTGVIKIRSYLLGALAPGVRIGLESESLRGEFKISKCTHTGSTWGEDWYTDMEAKQL